MMSINEALTATTAEGQQDMVQPLLPSFRATFMIVGAQKSGTTALVSFLSQHPDIFMVPEKETHFFSTDRYFENEQTDYAEYHRFYRHYTGQRAVGEATPKYMFHPRVAERLKEYNSALKLIVMLRHPVDRAYSHYIMSSWLDREPLSFSEAIREERTRLFQVLGNFQTESDYWFYSYASRGLYVPQIKNLLRSFPREQLLILRNEDLSARHEDTLLRVYEFLGVEPVYLPPQDRVFSQEYEPMDAQDRRYLLDLFARETDCLESMLGWDLSDWRT
jgi:hypothetical protein